MALSWRSIDALISTEMGTVTKSLTPSNAAPLTDNKFLPSNGMECYRAASLNAVRTMRLTSVRCASVGVRSVIKRASFPLP